MKILQNNAPFTHIDVNSESAGSTTGARLTKT